MTRAIELAKECGIQYFLCPEGTTEMHGFDRQVEAFAERVRAEEREKQAERISELEAGLRQCLRDLESFPRSFGMNFTKGATEARRLLGKE